MATNKMRAVHPGEILREEYLAPLGMSVTAFAKALHVPVPRINDVILERRAVSPDTAMRLAYCLNTTAEFWMNLQTSYDLKTAASTSARQIAKEVIPLVAAHS
jgi:addiction module HigA family antidote